ncbi:unnamed protein product [Mycena citricolor]|uniref:Fungal calcium binding protein domain-containing protein n=1 Tax=Mycena citricolor TaxID=2018698 RepID=A0AAD2HIM1_9AGAR|nr:unnamed protein product [Mycena citricolor]
MLFAPIIALAAIASAAPTRLTQRSCDLKSADHRLQRKAGADIDTPLQRPHQPHCHTALITTPEVGLSCGLAVAQADVDPFTDAGCILAAVQDAVALPASCSGCLASLGLAGDIESVKSKIEGIF